MYSKTVIIMLRVRDMSGFSTLYLQGEAHVQRPGMRERTLYKDGGYPGGPEPKV